MLAFFTAMSYKPRYAIGEVVDNAIQSWTANHAAMDAAGGRFAALRTDVDISYALSPNSSWCTRGASYTVGFMPKESR